MSHLQLTPEGPPSPDDDASAADDVGPDDEDEHRRAEVTRLERHALERDELERAADEGMTEPDPAIRNGPPARPDHV
ncbi:MAG TPA: hypothetical protein VJZ50_10055 [Candidatus Limnocylindrales bacterium]|nr:hypothetical protein [Candidatus Limnocylindrales bacterium]